MILLTEQNIVPTISEAYSKRRNEGKVKRNTVALIIPL